jgi:hypothetical protein
MEPSPSKAQISNKKPATYPMAKMEGEHLNEIQGAKINQELG